MVYSALYNLMLQILSLGLCTALSSTRSALSLKSTISLPYFLSFYLNAIFSDETSLGALAKVGCPVIPYPFILPRFHQGIYYHLIAYCTHIFFYLTIFLSHKKVSSMRNAGLVCSLLYSQHLEQCLTHIKSLRNNLSNVE